MNDGFNFQRSILYTKIVVHTSHCADNTKRMYIKRNKIHITQTISCNLTFDSNGTYTSHSTWFTPYEKRERNKSCKNHVHVISIVWINILSASSLLPYYYIHSTHTFSDLLGFFFFLFLWRISNWMRMRLDSKLAENQPRKQKRLFEMKVSRKIRYFLWNVFFDEQRSNVDKML